MSEKKKKSKKVKKDPLNKIIASIKKKGPIINKYYTYNKGGVTKASEGKPANSSYDSYVEMFVNAVDKATLPTSKDKLPSYSFMLSNFSHLTFVFDLLCKDSGTIVYLFLSDLNSHNIAPCGKSL